MTELKLAPHGEPFFQFYAVLLFLLVAIGFPFHAVVNDLSFEDQPAYLHLHAVSMGAWFLLVVVQASLVATGRLAVHKALGIFSLLLVPLIISTGLYVSWENWEQTGDPLIWRVNLINCVTFTIFYAAALLTRKRPGLHKRFIMFASLAFMFPALARWCFALGINEFFSLLMMFVLVALIPLFDVISTRRLSWAAGLGTPLFLGYVAAVITVASLSQTGP